MQFPFEVAMDSILDPLNDKQREAVLYTEGALLVLAGAGSGKTRVITHRFAYLLREKRLSPHSILAVTFTNKAAGEMKERIELLAGVDVRNAWIRTFHSMGMMILRRNPETIGYPRDFVIYDDTDSKNLVKTVMKNAGINIETFAPATVAERISKAKDQLETPVDLAKHAMSEFDDIAVKVYQGYEALLRKNRAVDYADLIALPIRVLRDHPPILESYRDLWRYQMVDEFQDTNSAQYELVKMLSERDRNIAVVGDDDQSIYGWRGAVIDNIYDFRDRYAAKVVPLEQNYRSTQTILSAANAVVEKIPNRMDKKLWTKRHSADRIRLVDSFTDREEANAVVEEIVGLRGRYPFRDFAIFYRTNAQSRQFEDALLSQNIPYKVFGGLKFYERKEIKDILSYIKLVINPYDTVAFERIINVPKRKIGDVTLEKLKEFADQSRISYVEALLQAAPQFKAQSAAIAELGQILYELNQTLEGMTPMNFVKVLLDAIGYRDYILAFDEDGADRWSNVEELINSVREFEEAGEGANIVDFINEISLNSPTDGLDGEDSRNYVSLMTIHNAKGLEFPVVFITGAVDGLIPHSNSQNSEKELYEERRLFYVAITRAKDRLSISFPETRMKYGDVQYCNPSPFLENLPEDLVERVTARKAFDRSGGGVDEDGRPAVKVHGGSRGAWQGGGKWAAKGGISSRPGVETKPMKKYIDREAEQAFDSVAKVRDLPKGRAMDVESLSEIKVGDWVKHRVLGIGKVTFVSERMLKADFEIGTQVVSGNILSSIQVVRDA
jgi:DNA helicase-2/ATP-dependent DNA helicase PcrA